MCWRWFFDSFTFDRVHDALSQEITFTMKAFHAFPFVSITLPSFHLVFAPFIFLCYERLPLPNINVSSKLQFVSIDMF